MKKIELEEFKALLEAKTTEYTADEIVFVWKELDKKAPKVQTSILNWLKTGAITEIVVEKYSLCGLMKERGLNYLGAAFTMDWLMRDFNAAAASIERGER